MSAGAATPREQRKPIEFPAPTKRREEPALQASNEAIGTFNAKRRTSFAAQTDNASKPRQDSRQTTRIEGGATGTATQAGPERGDRYNSVSGDTHAHPRSAGFERRSEGSFRPLEYFRDSGHNISPRERGEGRSERGRGGFRNPRGSSNGVANSHHGSGHQFSNGHPSHHQNVPAYAPPKAHSYNEHHTQQQGIQYGAPPQQSRGYRSGPRSQSIPNSAVYARFPNGPQQLPSIQTDLGGMYGYQTMHQGIMSAMPFNPYVEQLSVINMVSMQLEYYFSLDNLCKDMFLRKHMDSQGFVFLSVIANFNRIKQLTQDMELIRYVCFQSRNVEFRTGPDNVDRLRKRDGWQQWTLSMEERDPSAQNEGPAQIQQPRIPRPQIMDMHYPPQSRLITSPQDFSTGLEAMANDAAYQPLDSVAPSFVPIAPSSVVSSSITDAHLTQTPLSAAVPDFSPGIPPVNGDSMTSLNSHSREMNAFTDEQVDSLVIVVRKQGNSTSPSRPPLRMTSARTFSNGSIDGRTITEDMHRFDERQPSPLSNGNTGSEK
ncbi:MAG: hypothetical protein M1830_005884 [Pleopsidium flavum]|nr:MAG: hypothetical protein M1830_005884 [Pleopsidium flavum]